MTKPGLIDVHHHFVPESYAEALRRSGQEHPDGIAAIPAWSEQSALELLDHARIEKAYLSLSTPGVLLEGVDAAGLARDVNDQAADLVQRHPGRFGNFATLPLPDVEASLRELDRAFDTLGVDGVVLLTHYDGVYLGDATFDPVFDALDRRGAVVFLHPTSPACWECTALDFPRPGIEFIFDTTRTVTNLIYSGTIDRCPRISWIVPHSGAALPVLGARIDMLRLMAAERCNATEPVAEYLSRMYYDLAGPRTPEALRAVLGIAAPSQLLYGSDWPFTPGPLVDHLLGSLESSGVFDAGELEGVRSANARRLLG